MSEQAKTITTVRGGRFNVLPENVLGNLKPGHLFIGTGRRPHDLLVV